LPVAEEHPPSAAPGPDRRAATNSLGFFAFFANFAFIVNWRTDALPRAVDIQRDGFVDG
jgi:hypothetical protein